MVNQDCCETVLARVVAVKLLINLNKLLFNSNKYSYHNGVSEQLREWERISLDLTFMKTTCSTMIPFKLTLIEKQSVPHLKLELSQE